MVLRAEQMQGPKTIPSKNWRRQNVTMSKKSYGLQVKRNGKHIPPNSREFSNGKSSNSSLDSGDWWWEGFYPVNSGITHVLESSFTAIFFSHLEWHPKILWVLCGSRCGNKSWSVGHFQLLLLSLHWSSFIFSDFFQVKRYARVSWPGIWHRKVNA